MKAIQTKIITLLVCCTFFVVLVVELVSLGIMNRTLDKDATQIMKLLCAEQAGELNEYLHSVEHSVDTMHQVALDGLEEHRELVENIVSGTESAAAAEAGVLGEYLADIEAISRILADNTEGAIAVYYRLNPQLFSPTAGFFSVKVEEKEFENFPTTDLSLYAVDDKEHVFWYYEPVNAGKAVWLDPYPNNNIGVEMISYVAPVYYNGQTIGVVGMDIDINTWRENLQQISLYDTGFAVLLDSQGDVVYHPEYPNGLSEAEAAEVVGNINYYVQEALKQTESYDYELDAQERAMVATKLDNGMTFGVVVPLQEISEPSQMLMIRTLAAAIVIVIVFSMLSVHICKYIINIAYIDVMTGVKNKTAYEEVVESIGQEIRDKSAKFALIMFDINDLKPTNDTFGHDQGDNLIITVATLMQNVFGQDNVFRIGGDEFVVLLRDAEADLFQKKLLEFVQSLEQMNKERQFVWGEIKVARGATLYDYRTDAAYGDVFRRADALMYQNKKNQKEQE